VSRHDVDFITLDFTREHRFGWARHHAFPEWLSHPLGIAALPSQFPGDLRV